MYHLVMRRALATLSLLAASFLAQAQLPEDGSKFTGSGRIADGVGMNATLTWKAAGDTEIEAGSCVRECEGGKHAKHADCDLSCCKACPVKSQSANRHSFRFAVQYSDLGEDDNPPSRSHQITMGRHFDSIGVPPLVRPGSILDWVFTSHPAFTGEPSRSKFGIPDGILTFKFRDHWNTTPCSSQPLFFGAKVYIVTAEFELFAADGSGKRTGDGPRFTLRFKVLFPDDTKVRLGDPVVACKCEVKQDPKKETGMIPGWGYGGEEEYAWFDDGKGRQVVTGSGLGVMVQDIQCDGMTEATFVCNGNLFIPAGWELDSVDGNGQDVQLQQDLLCAATMDGVYLTIAPSSLSSATLRTLCLEIEKPEPRPGMKYRLVPPRSPAFARLARLTRESRFGGPWDQVRLWIATDFASYDRMAKTLVPMVGERTYLRELHRAVLSQAVSGSDPRVQKLMEPRFLLAKGGDPDDTGWLMGELLASDGPAVRKWLRGQKTEINVALAEKDGALQVGSILLALVLTGAKEDIETASWLIAAAEGAGREQLAKTLGAQLLAQG